MTIKKKTKGEFLGIIVSGEDQTTAIEKYRSVSRCENTIVVSSDNMLMATCSSDIIYDPLLGDKSLAEVIGAEQRLQSQSTNSEKVDAFFSVCTDSCGHVIVSDFEPEFCVNCSSALPELDDEETMLLLQASSNSSIEDMDDDMKQGNNEFGIIVAGASLDAAQKLYIEVANGKDSAIAYKSESGSFASHSSCDVLACLVTGGDVEMDIDSVADFTSSSSNGIVNPHYFQCASSVCDTPHIVSQSADAIFCPSCSTGLVDPEMLDEISGLDEDEDGLDELDEDDLDLDEDFDDEDFDDEDFDEDEDEDDLESDSGNMDDEDEDEDLDEDDEDFDEDEDEDDLESDSGNMDDEDEDEDLDEDEDDLDEDEDDLDLDDEDDLDEDEDEDEDEDDLDEDEDDLDEDEDEDDDLESDSSSFDELEIDLLSSISASEGGLDVDKLFVAHCGNINGGNKVFAFYGDVPVAMASTSSIGDDAQAIFNKPAFTQATLASVHELGVQEGLADMGFVPIEHDIDVSAVVESSIYDQAEKRIADIESRVDTVCNDNRERTMQAVASAMMAANRGQFRGLNNPIQDALVSNMVAAGFASESARQLVQHAFESHSDNYLKIVSEKANSLVRGPLDQQNQFAELVASSNFSSNSSVSNSIEDRLANPMHKTKSTAGDLESNSSNSSNTVAEDNLARILRVTSNL